MKSPEVSASRSVKISYLDSIKAAENWLRRKGNNLPALIISLIPLPKDNISAITNSSMIFVSIASINVEATVANHPYCSVTVSQVLAFSPQNRFIKSVGIIVGQLDSRLSTGAGNRVFDGLPSRLVHQSKAWETFFILHPRFNLCPLLSKIRWIGGCKNDFPITNGESIICVRLAVHLHRGLVAEGVCLWNVPFLLEGSINNILQRQTVNDWFFLVYKNFSTKHTIVVVADVVSIVKFFLGNELREAPFCLYCTKTPTSS
ncbi:ribosomal RNA small subunit methyltransferase A [Striga asiatica]|uniref:Ribosomal RNA small subunit methyltransferase A n=1 Tax=Striga asiatica TaxID=4170 RepID=A0A5A7Q678_STRAF|nr:ribosomal RNA small subunit methyltransferase A [Striga asiatica]